MPRLWRPSIPVEVKCRVVLRQLGEMWPDKVIEANRSRPGDAYLKGVGAFVPRRGLGALLAEKLQCLAELLNCKVEELRLDHDPPLAARPQFRRGLGRKTYYQPDANSVDHLRYRPHGTQHAGSHDTKTRIRGDHGQFSDLVLIKREKRRLEKKTAKNNPKYNHASVSRSKARRPKRNYQWPKGRKIQSRART